MAASLRHEKEIFLSETSPITLGLVQMKSHGCTDLWVCLTREIYLLNPNWKSSVFQQQPEDVIISVTLP